MKINCFVLNKCLFAKIFSVRQFISKCFLETFKVARNSRAHLVQQNAFIWMGTGLITLEPGWCRAPLSPIRKCALVGQRWWHRRHPTAVIAPCDDSPPEDKVSMADQKGVCSGRRHCSGKECRLMCMFRRNRWTLPRLDAVRFEHHGNRCLLTQPMWHNVPVLLLFECPLSPALPACTRFWRQKGRLSELSATPGLWVYTRVQCYSSNGLKWQPTTVGDTEAAGRGNTDRCHFIKHNCQVALH